LTPEFLVYFAWLAFCYYAGGRLVWNLSAQAALEHTSGSSGAFRHLRPGWMGAGSLVDLSDSQYRFFRAELPTLTLCAIGFLLLSGLVRRWSRNTLRPRLYFYATFSLAFLLFANGSCVAFMIAIVAFNYLLSELGARGHTRACTAATWVFNCAILLLNERYNGYRWVNLLGGLPLPSALVAGGSLGDLAQWLDNHRGQFGWQTLFNLVVLRMISFNMDRTWAAARRPVTDRDGSILTFEKHARRCADCTRATAGAGASASSSSSSESSDASDKMGAEAFACPWWREKSAHDLSLYSPLAYFVYLFYVPLHFAGPTITFNSFLSHVVSPQRSYDRGALVRYVLLKVVFVFLVLEWWLHHFYVFAYTNSSAFLRLQPYELGMLSYFTLVAIWLKFTSLWRFFRAWALLDGIEAPENMQRCVSNNYSIQSFWRAWHRSFNRWLVRYIYVPLGGGAATNAATPPSATQQAAMASGAAIISSPSPSSPPPFSPLPSSSSVAPSSSSSSSSRWLAVGRQSLNVFLTFSFVAFWHDRTMQLLAWGWLIALLFIPELAAGAVFKSGPLRGLKRKWYWRHIAGVGAALSIFTMMVANLIGYSVGLHGTSTILTRMVEQGGASMFAVIFAAFYAAAMVMFECRETGITVD
jgi:D-alanyl-lipoteichoic acid acyltransferase DltB (MBOAT superfamily)